MPCTFQKESLCPIKSQGTFSQLVEGGSDAPIGNSVVYPRSQQEKEHASRHSDCHSIEGDTQVIPIKSKGTPIEELDRNHVYGESSRPERKHGDKCYQTACKQSLAMLVNPFLMLMEEVSHPKHGQHEVHAINVAKRSEERDDTRQDGG